MGILIFLISFSISNISWADGVYRAETCKKESADDHFVFSDDFKWGVLSDEMALKFEMIYASEKRLKNRAYVDPSDSKIKMSLEHYKNEIIVPEQLIKSVRIHIEEALKKGTIEHVFFPDMGHSHFFIPQKSWNQKYNKLHSDRPLFYQTVFADPNLKILYHTAEQLMVRDENKQFIPDIYLNFRWMFRNLVGFNNGSKKLLYLDHEEHLKDHFYYGGGFNISSNKDGCFYYEKDGKKMYFDLSMSDLVPSQGVAAYD